MPLISFSVALLVLLAVVLVLATVVVRWRGERRRLHGRVAHSLMPRVGYCVSVRPGRQDVHVTTDGYSHFESARIDLNDKVHVRLVGPGNSSVLIAEIPVLDEDYEEQLQAATAKAEERAATLNALTT